VLVLEAVGDKRKSLMVDATPLLLAAQRGMLKAVLLLLDHGADTELAAEDGTTPLIWAASRGRNDVVRVLVERGANVYSQKTNGANAAIVCAEFGRVDTLRYLLEAGGYAPDYQEMVTGLTALIVACKHGRCRTRFCDLFRFLRLPC
jgi:hypothetical protein